MDLHNVVAFRSFPIIGDWGGNTMKLERAIQGHTQPKHYQKLGSMIFKPHMFVHSHCSQGNHPHSSHYRSLTGFHSSLNPILNARFQALEEVIHHFYLQGLLIRGRMSSSSFFCHFHDSHVHEYNGQMSRFHGTLLFILHFSIQKTLVSVSWTLPNIWNWFFFTMANVFGHLWRCTEALWVHLSKMLETTRRTKASLLDPRPLLQLVPNSRTNKLRQKSASTVELDPALSQTCSDFSEKAGSRKGRESPVVLVPKEPV